LVGDELTRFANIPRVPTIGADAGNPQQFLEFVLKPTRMPGQVIIHAHPVTPIPQITGLTLREPGENHGAYAPRSPEKPLWQRSL
jgi:hypothetical protein